MEPARDPALRPLAEVLGGGTITGAIAGLAAGMIDALWSWGPAGQFVPGVLSRVRFVLFSGLTDAAAGAVAGLCVTAILLVLSRGSRLGDLLRFAFRDHNGRREAGPKPVAGVAIVLATLPCVAACLLIAYRVVARFTAARKAPDLVLVVAMVGALAAIAIAIPLGLVIGRQLERVLEKPAEHPRLRPLSSPYAPFVVGGLMIGGGLLILAIAQWETVRVLPLRGPVVVLVGALLAFAAWRPARYAVIRLRAKRRLIQAAVWIGAPLVVLVLVLATGGSASVIKATGAYTGLGGPIARGLRTAFDWDRDGYSRFLGGGDCDDGDASVHPGAAEQPGDGIDNNCVGGDADPAKRTAADVGFAPVPPSVPKDFNVLLITIDTTRADHLGTYGYARKTTPNLDALAAGGTVFEHGWAHAPSTRYSMPAILTGRLPLDVYYDTSVEGWPGILPKATTIAETLDTVGFTSGAITNYWYFDRVRRMDQGFAEYDNTDEVLHQGVANAGPEQTRGSSSKEQTDKAIAFVGNHPQQRWFLWVHYYDPHYGYEAHPGFSFGTDRMAMYDGEIAFTDSHIGRLLDDLKAKGLYDKTVVVVTGDHGEGFGEHGIELHGYHLYSPQTRVPLIFRVPGLPPRRSQEPAGHVDILPTLANLAGAPATEEMMGHSLVPALAGTDTDRTVFQQLSYEGNHEMRAGVGKDCHVIYNVSPDTSWEVYRVDRDPLETTDLADSGECSETRAAVEKWFDAEQIPPGAAEALLAAKPAIGNPLDAELGDAVTLLSVDAPAVAKRGDSIALTWTFAARGAVHGDWRMFVHVEGPGKFFFNGDHRPARPFEWWKSGQYIRYTTNVIVPRNAPTGTFTVWAGMFLGAKRAHAAAPKALIVDDAVATAKIEVQP